MTATASPTPKSYLTAQEREKLLRNGSMGLLYLSESDAADDAGDEDAAWAWMSLVAVPAHALMSLKKTRGAQFIRDMNLNTSKADIAYGIGWLDRT